MIITDEETEPASNLEQIAGQLKAKLDNRFFVDTCRYDSSVSIDIRTRNTLVAISLFHVYPDGEVATNRKFASRSGFSKEAAHAEDVLRELGYSSFHNPFLDYVNDRFKSEIEKRESVKKEY